MYIALYINNNQIGDSSMLQSMLKFVLTLGLLLNITPVSATIIFLDFDTPTTGSNIIGTPLVTSEGTITVSEGELATYTDPDFTAAGASGYNFNIDGDNGALMSFSFDVDSISFIYGGNTGVFDVVARDAANAIVDSFNVSTGGGESAGPATLSGPGIRSIFFQDPGFNFAAIDNVYIETSAVPEPTTLALMSLGLAGIGWKRRKAV